MKKLIILLLVLTLTLSLAACGGEDGKTDAPAGGNTPAGGSDSGSTQPQPGNTEPAPEEPDAPETEPSVAGKYYLTSVVGPAGDDTARMDPWGYALVETEGRQYPHIEVRVAYADEPKEYGIITANMEDAAEDPEDPGITVYTLYSNCILRWSVFRDYLDGIETEERELRYDGGDTLTLDIKGTVFTFRKDAEREKTDPVNHIREDLVGVWLSDIPKKSGEDFYITRYTFRGDGTGFLEYLPSDEDGNLLEGDPLQSGEGSIILNSDEVYLRVQEMLSTIKGLKYVYIDGELVLYESIVTDKVLEKLS